MEQSWYMNAIRSFFAAIDRAIYGLMGVVYKIILSLANAKVIDNSNIDSLYTRIYAILGIFMLFKVTFSFINYVINPDSFTDKQKGVGNLIKNVIITLILIIITPFAFDKLYEAQEAILSDNLIPNFFFGDSKTIESNDNLSNHKNEDGSVEGFKIYSGCAGDVHPKDDGEYLALMTLKSFIQPEEGEYAAEHAASAKRDTDYCPSGEEVTASHYLKGSIVKSYTHNEYDIDYKFFISTIAGVVCVLLLISFCFDIAVRSMKLAFLQVIAPIPIISYVDPKSSQSGMFSKWLKEVFNTWLSLFIRFIALFFAVFVIAELDVNIPDNGVKIWTMLFLIIGALMFAKQLPKMLEELIPGLKMGNGFNLNPFKRISGEAIGGKALLGLGAAGIGMGAASISNLAAFGREKRDEIKDKKELKNSDAYRKFASRRDFLTNRLYSGKMTKDAYDSAMKKYMSDPDLVAAQNKFNEKQMARNRFSFRHPILANISQTMTGAKLGYKAGSSGKMPNIIDVGQKSSKVKDYKDHYSLSDRIKDTATDFAGIKNDSGTTSIVAGAIKDQEELLTRINRNIEMMNRQFSDLGTKMGAAEFSRAVSMNDKGRYELNSGYAGNYLSDIKAVLDNMNSLENQRLATTKEIKRLQKIKDKTPGDKK